jgi:hypothetical protein
MLSARQIQISLKIYQSSSNFSVCFCLLFLDKLQITEQLKGGGITVIYVLKDPLSSLIFSDTGFLLPVLTLFYKAYFVYFSQGFAIIFFDMTLHVIFVLLPPLPFFYKGSDLQKTICNVCPYFRQ